MTVAQEPIGLNLVMVLRRFMDHLEREGLSARTRRRHLDNLWLLGGEIIRRIELGDLDQHEPAHALLLAATEGGEALLIRGITEAEQNSVDVTSRRLSRFLSAPVS